LFFVFYSWQKKICENTLMQVVRMKKKKKKERKKKQKKKIPTLAESQARDVGVRSRTLVH